MLRNATNAQLILLLLICGSQVVGQEASSSAERVANDSLEHLSRNRYSSRQRATLDMWRKRETSRDQVQRAARHPDPEVSGRAKWILRQWRRGSLPDTPPDISRLLQNSDGPVAVQWLLEGGQFSAAVVAVEESAGTVDREAIEKRITAALLRRFPIYVHLALTSESLGDLLKLINLVADSKEMAVCRIQLMQQMGIEITADSLLPSSAATWSPMQRDRATAMVLITLGDVDAAIDVASDSVDKDLLHECRMIASRWPEDARDNMRLAQESESGSIEHVRLWCLALIAADRAGDNQLFDEAVKELSSAEASAEKSAAALRWKCLASHGEVDAALAILDRIKPDESASVAIDASRTDHAFDVLGYPLDQVDTKIGAWVDEAIRSQSEAPKNRQPVEVVEVRKILALMKCLLSIGRDDAAWQIAKRLSQSDVSVGSYRLREFVLSALLMTKRTDWIVQLAVEDGEKTLTPNSQYTISRSLRDADAVTFEIVMGAFATLRRGMPLGERVRATYQLLDGEVPDGFDPEVDFKRLYQYVTGPRASRSLRGRSAQRQKMLANLDVVNLFVRHGQSDLASTCLQKLAESGDVHALHLLGEQELDGGRAEIAFDLFQSVYKSIEVQGRTTGRYSDEDDVVVAVKALVGSWTIARRSGDEQLSAELLRELRLCLCSPSMRFRKAIADYLGERGEALLAMAAYEVLLPMTVLGTEDQPPSVGADGSTLPEPGLYDVARSYSLLARKSNVAEAARWFDLALGATLDSVNYRPGAYITLPLYVRRWEIEAAIGRKDIDETRRHLDRILRLDPRDIDFAERLLPEMRNAGMNELADTTLDQIIDRGLQYVDAFPFDAMTCNNLAWVAAMNHQRLDDALRLAESAVYVEPESAIYRDTLAEVLFLLDRKKEALQVEQGCLLDDPSQWHLHQQIRKYSESIENDEA